MVNPGVDAVVTNYQTPDDLARFLTSWKKYQPENLLTRLQIVNVDATTADTEVAKSFEERGAVEAADFYSNIGYGRACNLGAYRPCGDGLEVVALFNADVELTEGAIEECYLALTSHDDWGVLGPRQVNDERRLVHAGIVGTNANPHHRGWMTLDRGQHRDVLDYVPTVSGSAYFIKRQLWEELASCPVHQQVAGDGPGQSCGAFLPTPHYYEETWCSYHARAHGWPCVYFGEVTITHSWHAASPVGGDADRQMASSRELFRRACDAHGIDHD